MATIFGLAPKLAMNQNGKPKEVYGVTMEKTFKTFQRKMI
jgi:hypothetical protein